MKRQTTTRSASTSRKSRESLSGEQLASRLVGDILDDQGFYSDVITNGDLSPLFDGLRKREYPAMIDDDAVVALQQRLYDSVPTSAHKDLQQLIEQGTEQASLSMRAGFLIGAAYGRRVREREVTR